MSNAFNRLSSETSPYLLQHATNPVNWFPWGDDAFIKAKAENKLMLISIGYSSCHWCHVMEKDVFSKTDVAEYMNDNYVCVKVDREERPDVDQIYMNAVQIITRSGGWPLNCFTTPDGKPVFGGTYFPKEAWMDILVSLQSTWQNDPDRVIEVANELTQGVMQTGIISKAEDLKEFTVEWISEYVKNWTKFFDTRFGSHKGAPKFAMPGSLQFLLDYSTVVNDISVKDHVLLTLKKMAQGGVYDHLGGGFFRYSVDERWEVPHFEKMLYDNVQLISLYANAFKITGNEQYRETVYETINFLKREMRSPDGGFFSAIDADSEGEEGKFYTWTRQEIDAVLGGDAELFSIAFGVSASGNLHGRSVLRKAASPNETACVLAIDVDTVVSKINESIPKLFNARAVRVRPITDDKQILSWNALAISAFARASVIFNDKTLVNDAVSIMNFIEMHQVEPDGSLIRIYCKGKRSIAGFLDDYAYLIQAYTALYQSTFDEKWLSKANSLIQLAIDKFYNHKVGMFYFAKEDHDNLIARKMELTDGVMPSSGAVMAENLMYLSVYFRNDEYQKMATQMLSNLSDQLRKGGPYVYKWADIYLKQVSGFIELVSSGRELNEKLHDVIRKTTYPFIVPAITHENSRIPLAKISLAVGQFKTCYNRTCQKPTSNPQEVIEFINTKNLSSIS